LIEAFKNNVWDELDAFATALKHMKAPLPKSKKINAEAGKKALDVLNELGTAYANDKNTVIKKLEPKARKIGEETNQRRG
jgi:hypothetical protein